MSSNGNGQEPKVMNDDEILDLLAESIDSAHIGLYPTQNPNGADYYTCPFCYKWTNVMGNIGGMASLDEGQHQSDCAGMRLLSAMRARQAARNLTPVSDTCPGNLSL